jgi:pimeloyl-ACP methyl ester carboxylesterase
MIAGFARGLRWMIVVVGLAPQLSAQEVSDFKPSAEGWDTLTVIDTTRDRRIPIAIRRASSRVEQKNRVVLVSHGYNENIPGTYLFFSGIAQGLADAGYHVVSVQHEAASDELLPMKGDLRIARRPNWERGVMNLRQVRQALKSLEPTWDLGQVDLVGHSNGGDISMLYATLYPDEVRSAISLDNRRMPLPRVTVPHIATLRADDAPADPGVLPTAGEQERFRIDVVFMPGFEHGDMNDRATPEQREVLVRTLLEVLAHATR